MLITSASSALEVIQW